MSSKLERFREETEKEIKQTLELLRQELKVRQGLAFDLKKFCHPKQYAFVTDPNFYATAVTTRRSGKTTGCAADHIDTALRYKGSASLYITLTRSNAKKIMFPILCQINRDYRLGGEPNISDLSLKFPNDSIIYLAGVNDSQAIHNFRGLKFKLVTIDEGQSMRAYIKELIDEVLAPSLIDEKGRLRVTGTPGPVPVGYFHEISNASTWSHHFFSMFDNPFIENAEERLELELKRRGVTRDDPTIQREFFGKWAYDPNSLVIRYEEQKNHFDRLPDGVIWEYVVIADFGFDDADALAVLAFSLKHPNAYLVEEIVTTKQGITPLAAQMTQLIGKYKPMKVLGDFGALGKKIGEELQTRFEIPIEAAEKSRKLEYIELLNDSLRTGRLKAKKNSRFAQDAMLLEWDKENPEKPKISDRFHSDIIDCVIYGHRELLHWLWKQPEIVSKPGSIEFNQKQVEDAWEKIRELKQLEEKEKIFWNDPYDYDM